MTHKRIVGQSGCRDLTDKECENLINVVDNLRDRCLILIQLYTGLRITEVLSLKVEDIYANGSIKEVIEVVTKNDKIRRIYFGEELRSDVLKLIEKQKTGYLFTPKYHSNSKLSRVNAWKIIKKWCKKANIEGCEHRGLISCHSFRKTYAQKIWEETGELKTVQAILGHEHLQTTSKYVTVNFQKQKDVVSSIRFDFQKQKDDEFTYCF